MENMWLRYSITNAILAVVAVCLIPSVSGINPGGSCAGGNSGNCNSGTTCEDDTCKINPGGSCAGGNSGDCNSGTTCEDDTCKINPGGSCAGGNSGDCNSGTTCEDDTCKIIPGGSCAGGNSVNCKTGTTCEDDTCKINPGGSCAGGNSVNCKTGTTCEDDTCKINPGGSCGVGNSVKCKTGSSCEDNTCKINPGGSCASGNSVHCNSGTTCEDDICKINYGNPCNALQCLITMKCRIPAGGTAGSLCLCGDGHYRYSDACHPVNDLHVINIRRSGVAMTTSLTVQWTAPSKANPSNDLKYRVTITPQPDPDKTVTGTEVSFTNRTPGTPYTVSVITSAIRDPDHDSTTIETTAATKQIYTKPAQPGQLIPELHRAPDVTLRFNPSVGYVESYRVSLTQVGKENVTMSTEATFRGLTAGVTYQVTIVAVSGGIDSESQTDSFKVDTEPAGMVSQLNTPQNGSRWVKVTWSKPTDPKGDIMGYTVQALDGQQCVSAVIVLCSDCVYNTSDSIPTVANCYSQENITKTKNELDGMLDVNVTSLMPDVSYTILVNAFNRKGRGADTTTSAITLSEAAPPLLGLVLTPPAPHQLNVMWRPGERTGFTTYNVSWSEREGLQSDTFMFNDSVIVTGYSNTTYVIKGLLSYWDYQVTVFPYTSVGPPASSITVTTRTLPTEPGPVTEPNITQPAETATTVTLSVSCPREKQRNGVIRYISYNSTVVKAGVRPQQAGPSGDIQILDDCRGRGTADIPVVAESVYTFSIFAKSDDSLKGEITNISLTVQPAAPALKEKAAKEDLVKVTGFTTQQSVELQVCSCIVDTDQGVITMSGITLCFKSQDDSETCEPASGMTDSSTYQTLPTWRQFRKADYVGRYRPTPVDWHTYLKTEVGRSRRSVSKRVSRAASDGFVSYTIGDNSTCNEVDETVYCNGPLPEEKEFVIIIWACTSAGCSEAPSAYPVTRRSEDTDGPSIGGIVGGIVAALVAIVVVVVVVIVLRRRRRRQQPAVNRRTVNLEDTLHTRKSVSMLLFPARVEVLHRNSNQYFLQEFQELLNKEKTFGYTSDVGNLDVNRVKNRYQHLLPYDNTRVKLYSRGEPGQDYINASYVKGARSPCDYLATQGPMVSTIPDFWKMVWEQRSPVIVMLSDLTENGQPKVDEYWPSSLNSVVQYGDVRVNLVSVSTLPHYTVRTIKLLVDKEQERVVTHYHLSGWTDQGSSLSIDDIADIVYIVTEETASSTGPVTVHCSEGTMRTCSFIALHSLQRHVTQHAVGEEMDVFTVLLDIVKCRPHMMQSERQYMFIHDVVRVMVERKMRDDQGRRAVYQNAGYRDSALYDSTYAYIPDGHVYDEIGARKKTQTSEL